MFCCAISLALRNEELCLRGEALLPISFFFTPLSTKYQSHITVKNGISAFDTRCCETYDSLLAIITLGCSHLERQITVGVSSNSCIVRMLRRYVVGMPGPSTCG